MKHPTLQGDGRCSRSQLLESQKDVVAGVFDEMAFSIDDVSTGAAMTQYLEAANRADLRRGCKMYQYVALVTASPSPRRGWCSTLSHIELAQRRLAFAYSQLYASTTSSQHGAPFFWRGRPSVLSALDSDVVELVGRALTAVEYGPAPLRFSAVTAGSGYDIDGESGAVARAAGSLAETAGRLGDPRLRLAMTLDAPMCSGRNSAAFTVVHLGRWSGVHVGVAQCLHSEDAAGPSFWSLHSGTGWVEHDLNVATWQGMECFGAGDTMELLLDADEGRLYVKKNGVRLGEVGWTPNELPAPIGATHTCRPAPLLTPGQPVCWAVSLNHRDDAVRLERTDPTQFWG
jgi:hypothetical protein